MPETEIDRKSRFRAALALANKTAEAWAIENDITPTHLSLVLGGKRESRALMEKVDAFAEQYLGPVAA